MWNPESWALWSGIQVKESGIPITRFRLESRIQVPPTMTAIQYLESGIHIVESKIQDCLGFAYMGQKNLLRMIVMWILGGLLVKLTVNHVIICVASFKGFFRQDNLAFLLNSMKKRRAPVFVRFLPLHFSFFILRTLSSIYLYLRGILGISSDGDDPRIFLGLKFSIPGFFWVRKFGKYFFG